ncbi:hypothetical protein [Leifsonia sp. Leaf264]|uniref:hypothetical protein n=1 Tax=Leifsonia sp. Leaf264 TaxID=1736314 RepID=UPI0006FB79D7|nr:hypothetical protein [Leifsonia sp. Leaf264]KQO98847.1 hypothetical protein ASF30_12355 [Leifsonia sp. Leaf264]
MSKFDTSIHTNRAANGRADFRTFAAAQTTIRENVSAADVSDWLARNGKTLGLTATEEFADRLNQAHADNDLVRADLYRELFEEEHGYSDEDATRVSALINELAASGRVDVAVSLEKVLGLHVAAPVTPVAVPTPARAAQTTPTTTYSFPNAAEAARLGSFHDTVITDDGTVFRRSGAGAQPTYDTSQIRIQTTRPLDDDEMRRFAKALGYAHAATVRGEALGDPTRETPSSFIFWFDSTKAHTSDVVSALGKSEDDLPDILENGSPVRMTDRAGTGTAGTRLVPPFGSDIEFEIYYDAAV